MNCIHHEQVVSVAQCAQCSVGLCSGCVKISEYTVGNKPLCRGCNHKMVRETIAKSKRTKIWTLVKLVINAFFLIVGAVMYFQNGDAVNALIYMSFGGIPTAWKITSSTAEDRFRDSLDDAVDDLRNGAGSSMGNDLFRFIFRVIFAIIIGAVAAPILLIVNIVKYVQCIKRIKENEALMANFQ